MLSFSIVVRQLELFIHKLKLLTNKAYKAVYNIPLAVPNLLQLALTSTFPYQDPLALMKAPHEPILSSYPLQK